MRTDDLHQVPSSLPIPQDDGACKHLVGTELPSITLPATNGLLIDLSRQPRRWTVVYCYPRTGRPDQEFVGGIDAWNAIPGARGCTPQTCAYKDNFEELSALDAAVYGVSTQSTEYQSEAASRLHLPFPLLSDDSLRLVKALRLPTFEFAGMILINRLTMIIHEAKVAHVFYPIFPPDSDAERVIAWLRSANA